MSIPLAVFRYNNLPIYYRPNTVDEAVLAHSFSNDIFYARTPEYKGSKNALVIDVGGHIGTFSIYSLLSFKAGKVIALEPNKENFQILNKNVLDNHLSDRIVMMPYALSSENGTVKLYLDEENWGHSLTNQNLKNYEEVLSITLPSLLEKHNIEECDLIKFNCEGAEFRIILSTDLSTLRKIKMMIILFHEDMDSAGSRVELVNFLKSNGFLIRIAHEGSQRGWIIAKNKRFYSLFDHSVFHLKNWLQTRFGEITRKLQGSLAKTYLWGFVKRMRDTLNKQDHQTKS